MDANDTNRDLVQRFFTLLGAGDLDGALALMTDDATWWIAGKPGKAAVCGTLAKRQVAKLLRNITGALEGKLAMTVKEVMVEGDRVAAEVESLGQLKSGRTYNQEYHFKFTIREGRIASVREYLDTQHVQEVWATP